MTKEELIKNQFPNDEFLRSAVSQIVDKCTAELEKENAELKEALKDDKVCKCSHYFNFKDLEAELTKAKELLKDITSSYGSTEVSEAQMCLKIQKAEQFLKEEEA